MTTVLRPASRPSRWGISRTVAALSVGRRSSSGRARPGAAREARAAGGPPVGPSRDEGPGPAAAPTGRGTARRRRVEAELIGLRGQEPSWWPGCWERGLAPDPDPHHLFESVADPLPGVCVLHDLPVEGTETTIDHVVIGPGGVVVVDSVACPGRVRTDGVHLRVRGRDRSTLVDVALWRAEVVRAILRSRGLDLVPVHGVLHWQDADGLGPRGICLRGIPLLTAGAATGLAANGVAVSPLIAERVRATLGPAA